MRFYLLRFNPAGDTVAVTELPIRNVKESLSGMALSPDGRYLAVITSYFHGIRVYSLSTGAERSWVTSAFGLLLDPAWAGDSRTLAFFLDSPGAAEPGAPSSVYLLDTTSQSRSLLQASHPVSGLRRSLCGPAYFLPRRSIESRGRLGRPNRNAGNRPAQPAWTASVRIGARTCRDEQRDHQAPWSDLDRATVH